ncbi:MAG TPA: site-specific integrase [Candidatus Baltobacteraceae bacterium]|nr:site-specific integrase [Candidatus Baltobacteraceae bacterium]
MLALQDTPTLPVSKTYRAHIEPAAVNRARAFAEAAKSSSTRRAYGSDLRDFEAFCRRHGAPALPADPQTVALYASDLAQRVKLATIRRRMVAISQAHRERGLESPTRHDMVRRILQGIARTLGASQAKKTAITLDVLRQALLAVNGDGVKALRDRAILLLGFAAALRRSEIAALDVVDLHFAKQGLLVTIRRSKTDQIGEGCEIAVPYVANRALCAATAVRAWLEAAALTAGPAFRSFTLRGQLTERRIDGRDVANLVKTVADRARLEGDFSGHSLRAGFVTSAAEAGATLDNISRTTRHKSMAVLSGYIRRADLFKDPALASIVR